MKRTILLICLIFGMTQNVFLQTKVSGIVLDQMNSPIRDVMVKQTINNLVFTNENGEFTINLTSDNAKSIVFVHQLYEDMIINRLDTVSSQLRVRMKPMNRKLEEEIDIAHDTSLVRDYTLLEKIGFHSNNLEFNSFASVLSDENVQLLNHSGVGYAFDVDYINKNRLSYGGHFVINYDKRRILDSLELKTIYQQYGLHFGYKLFETNHFMLIPEIRANWNRYRLTNYAKASSIKMTQYLENKELDLRFNQISLTTGFHFLYKFMERGEGNYWAVGLYGAYAIPVFNTWVYSASKRVTTPNNLYSKGIVFGFSWVIIYN